MDSAEANQPINQSTNQPTHGILIGGNPRILDSKASCSESRLILIRGADLPLSECALYRQTEQERHFRWRGWMLRPRVIRSPTNPKWDRSRVRVPLRAACSFCFLFCRLSFFIFVCLFAKRLLLILFFIISKFGILTQKQWGLS